MTYKLKIGVMDSNSIKEGKVVEIFNSVKVSIISKRGLTFDIHILDYDILKKEFDKNDIYCFENKNKKGVAEPDKKIILIGNSFFDKSIMNQQSILLHEIGHIENYLPEVNYNNYLINFIYAEFLADICIFEVGKNIFLDGRIIPDLADILIDKIKKEIEDSNYDENVIKGEFSVIGRMYYYYSLYQYEPILNKINEVITLIKEYFQNIDLLLEKLKKLCNDFKLKRYSELETLFTEIDVEIKCLQRSQPNQPRPPINSNI